MTRVGLFQILISLFSEYYDHQYENPYFFLWISTSIFSSMFAYIWDIKLDWGLFDKNPGGNKFLREEIVYPSVVSVRVYVVWLVWF